MSKTRKYYPAFLMVICGLFSGCYTIKQGVTLLGYLNRAVPLEQSGDEEFIARVNDIRSFAMEELGLAMSKNYTRYVEIDRNYLASVVSASAKDSFTRHEWRFPIVGSVPYKGFFKPQDAQKEREKLEKKDLDVWVRGVTAFSTLGWFKDPLYSYMRNYPTENLADLLIHELFHATVFIKGKVKFNEELAEFVGSEGARLYMESRFGKDSDEYRKMLDTNREYGEYVDFIRELIAELDVLYSSDLDRDSKLLRKEEIINAAKERFKSNQRYGESFASLPVNNAYLELFRLYHTEDNFYEDLYEKAGRNLPELIKAAKTIKRKGDPRQQLEKALLSEI
jgi:predicted aminopeptidase